MPAQQKTTLREWKTSHTLGENICKTHKGLVSKSIWRNIKTQQWENKQPI